MYLIGLSQRHKFKNKNTQKLLQTKFTERQSGYQLSNIVSRKRKNVKPYTFMTTSNTLKSFKSTGSFDIARKRMMALKIKGLAKRFGVPRPVVRSRLVPRPLYKRHS